MSAQIFIAPEEITDHLQQPGQVIVDLCKPESYQKAHIPGAIYMDYAAIIRHEKPIMGLPPAESDFSHVLEQSGISPDTHVVAYDDEGGGRAGRLLWTLAMAGHQKFSLIDGGLHAWIAKGLPTSDKIEQPTPSHYPVTYSNPDVSADRQYILANLNNPDIVILDARSAVEFSGEKAFAARGGHIPGAINYDWTNAMDQNNALQMRPPHAILTELAELGINPDKEIIVHCQTHHRSAYSYWMLKALGFDKVRGYPGSWSDWGNHPDTPIEK